MPLSPRAVTDITVLETRQRKLGDCTCNITPPKKLAPNLLLMNICHRVGLALNAPHPVAEVLKQDYRAGLARLQERSPSGLLI